VRRPPFAVAAMEMSHMEDAMSVFSTLPSSRRARPIPISSPSSARILAAATSTRSSTTSTCPNVGDELYHFGYSRDQERLIVPDLFSNRIDVFENQRRWQADGAQGGQRRAVREERLHHSAQRDCRASWSRSDHNDRVRQRDHSAGRHLPGQRSHGYIRGFLRSWPGARSRRPRTQVHVRLRCSRARSIAASAPHLDHRHSAAAESNQRVWVTRSPSWQPFRKRVSGVRQ
jgi:hypothetical protein